MNKRRSLIRTSVLVAVLVLLPMSYAGAQIPQVERDALIVLYNSTNGNYWWDNTNWLGPVGTECTWKGVTCDNIGTTVVDLQLVNNFLTGTLPSDLANLSSLQILNLSSNLLTGAIPSALGNLTGLQVLNLSWNYLRGPIPAKLGDLPSVHELFLGRNFLTGSIPSELGNLASLQTLFLSSNQLTGPIPGEIGGLSSLRNLVLSRNHLTGSIPPELGILVNLTGLNLDTNQLTGAIPPELGNLSSLQTLNLSSNLLTGAIPSELGNLTSLHGLWLSWNQLTDPIPSQLGNLANLASLSLYGNQLTGSIPPGLGNLANLLRLDLYSNQLTGPIPPELGNLPNLRWLSLNDNRLMGPIPLELGNLAYIIWLDLNDNQLTGPIPPELGNLVDLQQLILQGNQLVGEVPDTLLGLTALTEGDVRWNGMWTGNPQVDAFLDGVSPDGSFPATQTVAPSGVSAAAASSTSAVVSWAPIPYAADQGGYEVLYATASGGPYTVAGRTADKTISSYEVSMFEPGTTYFIVVRTVTEPHTNNQNTVVSELSAEVVASTPEALVIATASLPGGVVSQPYSAVVEATGGAPPYAFAIAGGVLPPGLDLDAGAGEITGTPVSDEEYPFTVEVTDDLGQTAQAELGIVILRAAQIPDLGSAGRILFVLLVAGAGFVAVRRWAA